MKKILLPTDFSENARNAIAYAQHLFKDETVTFYLLHSYTPPIYHTEYVLHSPSQIGLDDFYQTNAAMRLETLKDTLQKEFNNPRHTFVCRAAFNTVLHEIRAVVQHEDIDGIVMGTKGATAAREILFGSTTVHVIKKSDCPVLAIPKGFTYEKPMEILFPTDYEIDYTKEQFNMLLQLIQLHKSRIHVLHVSSQGLTDMQWGNKANLKKVLGKGTHLCHDVPDNDLLSAINNFQWEHKMNLLVMVRNKHNFFERLFLGSVIKKIGLHVNIPFLVFPFEKK
ncbi:universal stress protein [Spongiimicrobium salis]|uniref:universal stress protein n=1 Tax=Spongiimicrobium salis TaxID=1667022 RepID=UPI00374D58C6